ncbi:MAG: tetratricopeptide repeat protein, partial [Raineya sp.]
KDKNPAIALEIAKELIDEQTDEAFYYVQQAQKFGKKDLEDDILLLLTEIYLRKHQDEKAQNLYQKLTQYYTAQKDTLNPKYLFIKSFWLSLRSRSYEAAQILEKYLKTIQASSVSNPDVAVLYLEYAADLMRIRNYSKALEVLKTAEEIYQRLNMQKYLGKLYNLKGLIYKNTNYLTLGIENYTKAIKIFRAYNPTSRNLAVSYVNLANIHLLRSKDTLLVEEAERILLSGVKLCEQIKDTVQLIHFHERLGFLYLWQQNTSKAKTFFEKGFELSKLIGSAHLQNYHQIRLADVFFQSGEKEEAIKLLERTLQKVIQDKNNELISEATLVLVRFYQNLNKHDEAIKYADFGIDISIKAQFPTNQALFYDRKIKSLVALRRWKDAQAINDTLLKIFEKDKLWQLKIYENQKTIDSAMGNYKNALFWAS